MGRGEASVQGWSVRLAPLQNDIGVPPGSDYFPEDWRTNVDTGRKLGDPHLQLSVVTEKTSDSHVFKIKLCFRLVLNPSQIAHRPTARREGGWGGFETIWFGSVTLVFQSFLSNRILPPYFPIWKSMRERRLCVLVSHLQFLRKGS